MTVMTVKIVLMVLLMAVVTIVAEDAGEQLDVQGAKVAPNKQGGDGAVS